MIKVIDGVETTTNEDPIFRLIGTKPQVSIGSSYTTIGMAPISSISKSVRDQLEAGTYSEYPGYILEEYGTLGSWTNDPVPTKGGSGVMSAYAYNKTAGYDDVYFYRHGSIWFTNAFTFTNLERAVPNLYIRPYAILKKDGSSDITLYDENLLCTSIGKVFLKYKDFYGPDDDEFTYVWKAIHRCYPDIPYPPGLDS